MSEIVQQPDALSFSGNLKPFLVSSLVDVSLQLHRGATLLLNEVYTPGPGDLAEIDLRKIIHQELSVAIPTSGNLVTEQINAMAEFTATVDGTPIVFTVIKGGVFRLKGTAAEWLGTNNQSWQPQVKKVLYDQPEWISRYATEKLWVRILAYFDGGTSEQIDLAILEPGKVYSIDCCYTAIDAALTGNNPIAWDVSFLANSGELRGYVQRYQLRSKTEQEHLFVWANTLGGIDSVSFTGHRKEDRKIEALVATLYDETLEEYDDEKKREIEQSTGHLTWYESKWLEDFFLSPQKYELDELGDLYRVAMTANEVVTNTLDDIYEYLLTFRYSDELPFLNIKRENMTIPAFIPDEINLPPLLRDLPIANPDGSFIIAVQDPNSPTWYQMSIDQLLAMFNCPCDGSEPGTSIGVANGFIGSIVWVSGLTYKSVTLVGIVNGQRYPVIDQTITLSDADPNLPRKDIFAVDTFNNLLVIEGIPAVDPIKPTPGDNQVEITHVDIDAAGLEPSNVQLDKVFDEGAVDEWAAAATSDNDITVNLADEVAPHNGTKAISVELAIPDATGEAPTHYIGEPYGGGRIFFLEPGGKKGLIAALEDQSASAPYQYSEFTNGTQDNVGIGMGAVNTAIMMAASQSSQSGMAAPSCVYYRGGGYSDWVLPSRNELDLMRLHKNALGGFTNSRYWSSTEAFSDSRKKAVGIDFGQSTGYFTAAKGSGYRARAIRAFDDTQQSYTKPVEVYSPTNTKLEFTAPATRELNSAILSFWMKTSKAWLGNTALLIESFLNGVKTGGVLLQAANANGFDANNTDDWQQVVVQLYNFGLTTKQIDKLRISAINSWPNGIRLQLDSIRIQSDPEQEEADPDFGYRANEFSLDGIGPHAIQFQKDRYMPDTNYFPLVKAFQDGFEVGYANITKRVDGFDITFNEGGLHTGNYLMLKYF